MESKIVLTIIMTQFGNGVLTNMNLEDDMNVPLFHITKFKDA